jgi:heptosyltransferase-2
MKLLVIKIHYIGDVVMITPALRRLKQTIPEAQIDVLVGNWSRQVLENNPHLNRIISVPNKWLMAKNPWNLFKVSQLLVNLRKEKYDGVLIFHHNRAIRALGRVISAPVSIAYHPNKNDSHRFSLWDTKRHGVLNAISLVDVFCQRVGVNVTLPEDNYCLKSEWIITEKEVQRAKEFLESVGVFEPPIIVHPGAGKLFQKRIDQRRWFPERFVKLITELLRRNFEPILLEGAEFEQPLAHSILKQVPSSVGSIVGRTNLRELAAVLSNSRMLITNDTGTMHIGGAVGIPVVAVFGPTGGDKLLPLEGPFRAVQSQVPCSPCYYGAFRGCLFKEYECMKEISVERVLDSVLNLLVNR